MNKKCRSTYRKKNSKASSPDDALDTENQSNTGCEEFSREVEAKPKEFNGFVLDSKSSIHLAHVHPSLLYPKESDVIPF